MNDEFLTKWGSLGISVVIKYNSYFVNRADPTQELCCQRHFYRKGWARTRKKIVLNSLQNPDLFLKSWLFKAYWLILDLKSFFLPS